MEVVEKLELESSEIDTNSSPYVHLSVANHGESTTKSEIVISGISGKFPESSNVEEFAQNLFSGVDMVTDDDRRWPPGLMGLPTRSGKLKELDKFDAGHFGVNSRLANFMDPQLRILHELTFEAILDAGVNPSSIRGSKTGVFIGTSVSESETMWTQDPENTNGYPLVGSNKAMFANRISFSFDFQGPSFTVDTACSSSLLALELALSSIRKGDCEAAIVAGVHLCLSPMSCINTNRLHMLSKDGKCKSFDASGKGYVRSEAVVVVYIQKKDLAHRSYATIVHAKTNADGFKALGVTFPSGERQAELLEEVYEEAGVDPREVTYVEAHGTGTPAGDPQEMNAITKVFCKEGRDPMNPLLVGSVKSNLGHSEPSSGLCGVVKVLIAFQRGEIPANLHFKKANPDIPALADGRIKVVSQNTKWEGGFAGVNSFGFGGSNVHVILKSNPMGKSELTSPASKLPLLVPFSGRTRDSVESALRALVKETEGKVEVDQELISLMHAIYSQNSGNISGHNHRGYAVFNPHESQGQDQGQLLDMEIREHSVSASSGQKSPIWFIFSGMGSQWKGMAKDALNIPVFAQSIKRSQLTLKNYININNNNNNDNSFPNMSQFSDFDLEKSLSGENSTEQDQSIIETFVSIVAVQIGLVDLLKSVGVEPDGIIGHSLGELTASYADGCMTAEQTILAALCRGMATEEIRNRGEMPLGAMASVGLTWEEAVKKCPPGIYPACHNSTDNVTVSGPALLIQDFIRELESEGIFSRKVDTNGYAFHTPYISKAAEIFKTRMTQIVPNPLERTKKWISSSSPQSQWEEDEARFCSGEYHANNMISPVLFKECLEHVPLKALVIEIGPHALLQSILKRSLPPANGHAHIGMMNKNHPNNAICILNSLGKLYNHGHCPTFSRLYENENGKIPSHEFPVSAATRSLSPLIKWDHSVSWNVARFDSFQNSNGGGFGGRSNHGEICMEISLKNEEDKFYQGHKIESRLVFPATGYLLLVWKSFAQILGRSFEQVPIVFEQVRIQRATFLPQNGSVKFLINIFQGSGEFQIRESDFVVMSGIVRSPSENVSSSANSKSNEFIPFSDSFLKNGGSAIDHHKIEMKSEDIYKELRLRGYEYSGEFQGIQKIQGSTAEIRWSGNFVSFLDTILQTIILAKPTRALFLPSFIDKLVIDPVAFLESIKQKREDSDENCDEDHLNGDDDVEIPYEDEEELVKTVQVYYNEHSQLISCEGIQFQRIQATIAPKKNADHGKALKLETYKFAPYFDDDNVQNSSADCLRICGGILSENCMESMTIKFTQIIQQDSDSWISSCLHQFIQSQPLRTCAGTVVHFPPEPQSEPKLESKEEPEEKFNSLLKLGMTVTPLKREEPDVGKTVAETTVNDDLIILEKNPLNDFLVQSVIENLKIGAFILLHCPLSSLSLNNNFESELEILQQKYNLILVSHKISTETHFFLFKKIQSQNPAKKPIIIEIDPVDEDSPQNYSYDWVDKLKEVLSTVAAAETEKAENIPKVYVVSKETADATSGVVGLLNSLKLEPGGRHLRCFFIKTRSRSNISLTFDDPDDLLSQIMERDLFMNILEWQEDSAPSQRGQWTWGSYRFLPLEIPSSEYVDHAYVNVLQRGNLATLRWFESPLKYYKNPSQICSVYYAALNFRDVMIASGKLPLDALPNNYGLQDCVLGMEFSGKTPNGQRVMGLLPAKALATSVIPHPATMYNVPKNWTLKEAATVPVAFSTVYYGLIIRGKMRPGESILIHAGAGGVGIAAITLALHMKCKVYTTVGTEEKRTFLKNLFPQLQNDSFANSRDTSFLQHIMHETKGKGVDLVLNSLSEEKLQASVKCLAQHGRFLEIGKLDLFKNSNLGMTIFLKNVSVHGILFDSLTDGDKDSGLVKELMEEGLKNGVVRPLPSTVFSDSDEDVENAFRTMAVGKHMGKILIQIRQEDSESEKLNGPLSSTTTTKMVKALPRTYFDPAKIYIIVGGLGGFGLELCGWMIERGASKLVLTSRSGVKTGYQAYCLQKWAGQGASVMTSTINVTTTDGATNLLQTALQNFGGLPKFGGIGGIFNLAMVLADGLFENQTAENFIKASTPKINGSIALDQVSRKIAPSLEYFICFSSAYSGRGGPGLSNYSWANSFLDRLCERRQREGYSALSIQWAAVGDVGVLQDEKKMGNETLIGGTIPQRVISCFNTLDIFLPRQDKHAVLSSIVIPEKRRRRNGGKGASDDGLFTLTEKVAHILGIEKEEVKNVDPEKKLYELGMDSLMGVEIKQMIEMNTNVVLTPKDVIDLTFGKIKEMKLSQNIENGAKQTEPSAKDDSLLDTNKNVQNEAAPLKSESNGNFTTIEIATESAEVSQKETEKTETVKEPDFELDLETPFKRTVVQKFTRGVKSCFLYIFGLCFMLFLGALLLISLTIRQFSRLSLALSQLFSDKKKYKIVDLPCAELFAMNPRTSNVIYTSVCSGVPYKSRIIKTLDQRLVNWRTNIVLDKETTAEDPEYQPYEPLKWRVEKGWFSHYWKRDESFNVRNHIIYEKCEKEADLQNEALRVSEFYHNYKWAEPDQEKDGAGDADGKRCRPQWEVRVIAPKYDMNHPKESKEFLVVVAVHHVYGDAISGLHMLQYAFSDQKIPASIVREQINGEIINGGIENENDNNNTSISDNIDKTDGQEKEKDVKSSPSIFSHIIQFLPRVHKMALEMSRTYSECYSYKTYCKEVDSKRHCGVARFNLTRMKSIKNPIDGKPVPLTTVVLTCTAAAYEKLHVVNGKKSPRKICAMMPYAIFPYKRLGLLNNFSGACVPIPISFNTETKNNTDEESPNSDSDLQQEILTQRMNMIQNSIKYSSTRDKLVAVWNLSCLFSLLTIQMNKFILYLSKSPTIVYTNVPATIPKHFTFFGGYSIKKFFGFTALVNKTQGTLASIVDSENDEVALSFVVDESVKNISPDFLNQFFKFFEEELGKLTRV